MAGKRLAFDLGTIALSPISVLIWILFIIFSFSVIIKGEKSKEVFYLPADWMLFGLVIFAFLSHFSSYYIGTPMSRSSIVYITAVIEPIFFYFLLRKALTCEKRIKFLLFSIILAIGIGSIIGYIYMLSTRGNLILFLITRGGSRGFGFRGTNLYGIAAVLVFPITLFITFNSGSKLHRTISTVVRIMMFIGSLICLEYLFRMFTIFCVNPSGALDVFLLKRFVILLLKKAC